MPGALDFCERIRDVRPMLSSNEGNQMTSTPVNHSKTLTHEMIMDAIRSHDPAEAARLMREYASECERVGANGLAQRLLGYAWAREQNLDERPAVHGEKFRQADGTCGCDLCRFGSKSNIASALRHDLPLGPIEEPPADEYPNCPICGDPIDHCQGHGSDPRCEECGRTFNPTDEGWATDDLSGRTFCLDCAEKFDRLELEACGAAGAILEVMTTSRASFEMLNTVALYKVTRERMGLPAPSTEPRDEAVSAGILDAINRHWKLGRYSG